jgi:hypothetical protein
MLLLECIELCYILCVWGCLCTVDNAKYLFLLQENLNFQTPALYWTNLGAEGSIHQLTVELPLW